MPLPEREGINAKICWKRLALPDSGCGGASLSYGQIGKKQSLFIDALLFCWLPDCVIGELCVGA